MNSTSPVYYEMYTSPSCTPQQTPKVCTIDIVNSNNGCWSNTTGQCCWGTCMSNNSCNVSSIRYQPSVKNSSSCDPSKPQCGTIPQAGVSCNGSIAVSCPKVGDTCLPIDSPTYGLKDYGCYSLCGSTGTTVEDSTCTYTPYLNTKTNTPDFLQRQSYCKYLGVGPTAKCPAQCNGYNAPSASYPATVSDTETQTDCMLQNCYRAPSNKSCYPNATYKNGKCIFSSQ